MPLQWAPAGFQCLLTNRQQAALEGAVLAFENSERQALLVDHDAAVNSGNWAYNAGVGLDPRNRTFRTVSQGAKYDPEVRCSWPIQASAYALQLPISSSLQAQTLFLGLKQGNGSSDLECLPPPCQKQ